MPAHLLCVFHFLFVRLVKDFDVSRAVQGGWENVMYRGDGVNYSVIIVYLFKVSRHKVTLTNCSFLKDPKKLICCCSLHYVCIALGNS